MGKSDLKEYISYLEGRLEKYDKRLRVGDEDINTLLDVQNEIEANNFYDIKRVFYENSFLKDQVEHLQKKSVVYDGYIDYLMNSFWWKITKAFRVVSRRLRKLRSSSPLPFSFPEKEIVNGKVHVFIYASMLSDNLGEQIDCVLGQLRIKEVVLTILNLDGSKVINDIAKKRHISCINILSNNDFPFTGGLINDNSSYHVFVGQRSIIDDDEWLYKIVYPIEKGYCNLSLLFNKKFSSINDLKDGTTYDELRVRIFSIADYECLLFPKGRDDVPFIPQYILDQASIVARNNSLMKD